MFASARNGSPQSPSIRDWILFLVFALLFVGSLFMGLARRN